MLKLERYSTYNHYKVGLNFGKFSMRGYWGWYLTLTLPTINRYVSGNWYIGKYVFQLRYDSVESV